jgi:hypothetical protein
LSDEPVSSDVRAQRATIGDVTMWIDVSESDDPWGGRQPHYERIVKIAPGRFGLVTRLPSGEPITVPLDRLPQDQ